MNTIFADVVYVVSATKEANQNSGQLLRLAEWRQRKSSDHSHPDGRPHWQVGASAGEGLRN